LAAQIEFPDVRKLLYQADGGWIKVSASGAEIVSKELTLEHHNTADSSHKKLARITDASVGATGAASSNLSMASNKKPLSKLVFDTYTAFSRGL
jgi:hypothetical protein